MKPGSTITQTRVWGRAQSDQPGRPATLDWHFALAMLLGASLFAAGCNSEQSPQGRVTGDDVKQEAKEALDATARLAQQEKDEFIRTTGEEMNQIKSDLESLKQRAQVAHGEGKAKLDAQVEQLEEKWNAAEAKVAELRAQSAETWQEMKGEVVAALDDLKQSYREVRRSLAPA